MKIIHFIYSIDKSAGGTAAYLQLISKELKKSIDLIVVTGKSTNPINLIDIKVTSLDLSFKRWFNLKKEFLEILTKENPDLVHINGIWTPQNWLFQKIAQQLGIKVVLSPHGMLESYILNRHPLKKNIGLKLYQHKALKSVDYFHVTAQSELDQVRKLGYMQPAQIIANGIEIGDVRLKTEWKKVQTILFLSRVHPKKGLELLIEAIANLNNTTLKIVIAGEGEQVYIESLKKLAVEKNVSQQFKFVGGVYENAKWKLYKEADLFVLPTYSENFGIVVPEALATGLSVITTTGTPWQELETYKCGWWIDLNVPNLVQTITKAINTNPVELKQMGLNARKLVAEMYDIKTIAVKMQEYYSSILNKK